MQSNLLVLGPMNVKKAANIFVAALLSVAKRLIVAINQNFTT